MKHLYIIGLGGKAQGANIEVHDIQLAIAEDIESLHKPLLSNWYGSTFKLHLDSYKALEGADGYKILIKDTPQKDTDLSLFFANFGGYDPKSLLEIHKVGLFVCKTLAEAKSKASTYFKAGEDMPHIDNIACVDNKFLLEGGGEGYIHLIKTDETYDLTPNWHGYLRLDQ